MTACETCKGSGFVMGGDEYQTCPGCRLTARRIEADRIRAAAEDSVESAYRDQFGPDYRGLAVYGVEGR